MLPTKNLVPIIVILLLSCSARCPSTELSSHEQCEILYKNRIKSERLKRSKKLNKSVAKAQSKNTYSQPTVTTALVEKQSSESFPMSANTPLKVESHAKDSVRISIPTPGRERHINNSLAIIANTQAISPSIMTVQESKKWKFSKVPFLIALSGLISVISLTLLRSKAKSLSRWAATNPRTSQGLIATSHVVVGGTAFLIGGIFYDHGFLIPEAVTQTALACGIGTAVLYPFNNTPRSYFRRKTHDIALFGAGTILALSVGNNHIIQNRFPVVQQPMIQVQSFVNDKIESALTASVVNQYPEKKPRENVGLKALLTLLTLLAFGGLGVLVAALSCNLSCSGAGTLATVVLIGGAYLVIAGAAAVIRKIWGIKRRRDRVAAVAPTI